MKRFALALVLALLLVSLPVFAQDALEEFSIIVLPDTQYYSYHYPEVHQAQTQWIVDNKEKLNIKMVIGVGDITDTDSLREWQNADVAIKILEAGSVPYVLALGNHDMPGNAKNRDTSNYNATFPLERLQSVPGWGGRMGEDNDNYWRTFEAAGFKFMVLTVEFGPTDDILNWANEVVANHPDHKVIVTTHCYMNCDDTRVGNEDGGRPQDYQVGGNDGQMMWEKFIRKHENIFLVVSGHIVCDESQGMRIDKGEHGNRIVQLLTNYQDRPMGGNGWLKILQFAPERDYINVTAYSPYLDAHAASIKHTYRIWHRLKDSE